MRRIGVHVHDTEKEGYIGLRNGFRGLGLAVDAHTATRNFLHAAGSGEGGKQI